MKYFKHLVVRCLFPTVQARDGLIMELLQNTHFEFEGHHLLYVCDHMGVEYDFI